MGRECSSGREEQEKNMRAGKPGASSRARDGGLLMEHLLKWGHSKEVGRQGGLGT